MLVYCQHEVWCVLQRYVPCVLLCSQPLGSMLFHGVHTIGIVQSLHFKCSECPHEATLNRPTPLSCSIPCDITSDSVEDGEATESGGEDEGEDNGEMVEVDIEEENLRLVLGCILCGRGRVNCSKLLAMLDLPDLSYRQWTKGLKILSHCVGELSESSMDTALKEEIEHAKRANKPAVDWEGRSVQGIAAASDGFWAKRRKSLTGSADVIGVETGKVLAVHTLNMSCSICNKHLGTTPPPHKCTVNYKGSSQGMESVATVACCCKLVEKGVFIADHVGDCDSNTVSKIKVCVCFL